MNEAIQKYFGSCDKFREAFAAAAVSLFGSGWVWLTKDKNRKLEIIKESNAGNPLRNGYTPLLTCDVWEHAYYLDKQNRRPDYVESFWEIVDWNKLEGRY